MQMLRFVIKRLMWGIPVLVTVATITFVMMHVVPGGPFDKEKKLPPEIAANVEAKYHLDKPIYQQYLLYISGLATGDLGPSYKYVGRSVRDVIGDSLPVSLQLGLLALLIAVGLGVSSGIMAAARPNSLGDHTSMFLATAGIATPNFVLGAVFILIFAHASKLFPPALWEGWRHMVLPALTLGLSPAAYIARLTRASILEVTGKDYIRTVKAKGFGEGYILLTHVLKNSIPPVVTILGPLTATLVTGSFVVEFIFSVPGMGKFFITAVTNRDYPLIMGVTLVYAVLIVLANMLVDILYALLDPRVRVE